MMSFNQVPLRNKLKKRKLEKMKNIKHARITLYYAALDRVDGSFHRRKVDYCLFRRLTSLWKTCIFFFLYSRYYYKYQLQVPVYSCILFFFMRVIHATTFDQTNTDFSINRLVNYSNKKRTR